MRRVFFVRASVVLLLMVCGLAQCALADVYVRGYYRRDGTCVRPHWRSDPDGNPYNNWSFMET